MSCCLRRFMIASVVSFSVVLFAADNPDAEKVRGIWNCVSAVIDGRTLPEETVKQLKLTITNDKYKTERGEQVLFESVYKLDETKKPREIDIVGAEGDFKGKTAQGIYVIEGDRLRLCYSMPGNPRPTAFESKPGSGAFFVVWKRAIDAGDAVAAEFKKMDGTWTYVEIVFDGNKLPADQIQNARLVQAGNKYTIKVGDAVIDAGTLAIDPAKKPKTIDAVATEGQLKGKTLRGIYEFEGDDYKICFGKPDGPRATEFTSTAGSGNILIVYKREKS